MCVRVWFPALHTVAPPAGTRGNIFIIITQTRGWLATHCLTRCVLPFVEVLEGNQVCRLHLLIQCSALRQFCHTTTHTSTPTRRANVSSCMLMIKQSTNTETFAHIIRGTGSIDTLPQCSRRMEEEVGRKEEVEVAGRREEGEVVGRMEEGEVVGRKDEEVVGEQEGEGEEMGGCSEGG